MTLKEISKEIANKAGIPYCWEDIQNRLENGLPLPFKIKDDDITRTD